MKYLKLIKLPELLEKLETALEKAGSVEREKLNKRIGLVRSMIDADVRPEWMFSNYEFL